MATINLKAESRESTGKGAARKIRATGSIPSVVYRGGESATSVSINPKELELQFQRSGNPNTLVELELADGARTCLVQKVQRHPVSGEILHVDFYEVVPDQQVQVNVPVETEGRAAGVRAGGKLQLIQRELTVRCRPGDIPATVKVDVTNLEIGKFIRASQVPAPANTELVITTDANVVTVIGKRGGAGGGGGKKG